jgi:hypothetical protein
MENDCMNVVGARLDHRRDGEVGSERHDAAVVTERQSLYLILLVYRVRGEEVMGI